MTPFISHLLPKRLTRWLQRLWWALACLVLLLGTVPALAQGPAAALQPTDLILDRAYWRDHTGQASLAQAQQHHYTPFRQGFSGGYTDAVHWLRLTLAASDTPISLRLLPPWIDEITLYDPATPHTPHRAGDRHPRGVNSDHVLGYAFTLPAAPQARQVWLQLRSTSAHQLTIQAMPADQLPAANTRAIVWTALYAAVLLLMLLALLSIWWVQRDAVLTTYLVRHTNYILYGVTYLGLSDLLLYPVLPTGWMDLGFSIFVVMTLPLGLWFDITLLKTYKPHRLLTKALQLLAWSSLALVPLLLSGHVRLALQTTVLGLTLAIPLVFLTAWTADSTAAVERLMSKRVLLGYYTLVLSSLLIGMSGLLGWGALQGLTPYLLTLHGLLSGLVMTVILFVRGQRQHQTTQHMRWQLQKAQQEMELEQRRREEQSQFLHMLMHELKTPLSVVSLALGTRGNREENLQHASRAVQDMKAIIDRCVEADQLGQLSLQPQTDGVDLQVLLQVMAERIPRLASRLQVQGPEHMPMLRTDRQLLEIILSNLLDNASCYSDPLTPVTVQVQAQQRDGHEGLALTVRNTPGLAGWPDAELLFGKYYRASGAQSESGSGLGLFLSRQLAQTLGGTLVYAPSERFVEFELWLPLSPV